MDHINFKTKNLYGLIGMGDAVVYCVIGTFLLFFLTTVTQIPPAIAGTIAALGSVWDVIASSLVAYLSDRSKSRHGRRRPFIMAGAFPLGVATALIFTTVHLSQPARIAYYMIMLLILWTAFCVFYVPYLAWGAELTQDYDERTALRGYVYVYNTLGAAMGTILPTIIVDALLQVGCNEEQSWQAVGVFCGLTASLVIFFGAKGIRVREMPVDNHSQISADVRRSAGILKDILRNYWEILLLRSARCIILASIFYLLANTIISSDRMYFYTYNLHMPAVMISAVMAFQSFVSVVFVPFLIRMTKRYDKRSMFLAGMGISLAASVFYGLAGIGTIPQMFVYSFFISIGNICYWQLIAAMIYDVCEADQLKSGKKRSGMVISMQSISESLSEALALQLLGIILGLAGFDGQAQIQSDTALLWTHLSLTLIPALFLLLSLICVWRYPITKEMYCRILDALRAQKLDQPLQKDDFACL